MKLGFWNFYPFYNGNRMFTDSYSPIGDDLAYSTVYLGKRLRALGHQPATLDMEDLASFDAAIFFDHPTFLNPKFRRLRALDTKLYLFLAENAAMRPDNYWRFNHAPFEKVFTWNPQWVDNKKYFKSFLTLRIPDNFRINPDEKLKFCVTIASQKYSSHPKEIYSERVRIIRWFEREHPSEFDLYGTCWDRLYFTGKLARLNLLLERVYRAFPKTFHCRRFPSHRGTVNSKNATMRHYKFAVCYENSVFPGYVSEKIFDGLFAGCIPIYLGAPDITDYIPPDVFIDRRNFNSNEELYRYLVNMPQAEYERYLDEIESFVRGEQIKPFGPESLTNLILKQIVESK